MALLEWSLPVVVGANVVGSAVLHAGTGWLAHRTPLHRLRADGPVLRLRAAERDGRLYERVAIRRWKDRLPEAGATFDGGVSKRHLAGRGTAQLERFVAETRRAERAHWWALAGAPAFTLWNPPAGAVAMVAYGVVSNGPCIAIQRYNRARLTRVLARRVRAGAASSADGPRPPSSGSSMP